VLTDRCREIVGLLARHVRVLTAEQLARTWWPGSTHARQNAITRMRQLEHTGLVHVRTVFLHPEITLAAPLATWCPGQENPHFGKLAWHAAKRWRAAPTRTLIVTATEKGRYTVGAPPGRRAVRTRELVHDIHVAQVLLAHYFPDRTDRWTAEDQLLAVGWTHRVVPDALVQEGGHQIAIDFIGAYSAAKIAALHKNFARAGLSYQLW
jgi:hypothetical protein